MSQLEQIRTLTALARELGLKRLRAGQIEVEPDPDVVVFADNDIEGMLDGATQNETEAAE